MHSFEVHSNESACRKSGRLGLDQVITTLVPGGDRGVLLKLKKSSNFTCAESFGFDLAVLNRFNVIWDFLRRLYQSCIGGVFPKLHSPAMKLLFHVQMAFSTSFLLCVYGGDNSNATDCCLSKVLMSSEASFSVQCVSGLNPMLANFS